MAVQVSGDRRLFELARKFSEAKRAENDARERRIEIEQEIVAATGFAQPSGSQTFAASCEAGSAAVTIRQPVTTNVVAHRMDAMRKILGKRRWEQVFQIKYAVIAKGLSSLQDQDRDAYLLVADCLVRKPGKIGVELKSLEVV